jgi:lysophospholipase L1-like esterase
MKKIVLLLLVVLTISSACKKTNVDRYSITNAGIAGNTSANLVARVDGDVISYKPQLVIILIGTNDALAGAAFSLTNFRSNMVTLITKLQAANAKVLLLSPPPYGTDTIGKNDYINNNLDTIASALGALSKQYNCSYYDLHAAVIATGTPNATAASLILNAANSPQKPDGIHFTKPGIAFLAGNVYNFIKASQLTGCYHIVCFGDSITVEYGDMSYPLQLQFLLDNN